MYLFESKFETENNYIVPKLEFLVGKELNGEWIIFKFKAQSIFLANCTYSQLTCALNIDAC